MNVVPLRPTRIPPAAEPVHALIATRRLHTARRLHLLDIENLCGTSHLTTRMVTYVLDAYRREIGIGPSDHVAVGVSHHNALAAGRVAPEVRLCVRSGADGADLALLDVLGGEQVQERFVEIYLGTGDGVFADLAATMADRGAHVRVVAGFSPASRRLRLAAGTFTQLSFKTFVQEHA
ncbi:NYN domain-containing protein [Rhodococcus hoagii]|nr:NYN domain-containing protein [Prescottella equi]